MTITTTPERPTGAEAGSLALRHTPYGPQWSLKVGGAWRRITLAEAAALAPERRHELARRHLRALEALMADWLGERDEAVAGRIHVCARRMARELGEVNR